MNRQITVGTAIFVQGNYERTREWYLFPIRKITRFADSHCIPLMVLVIMYSVDLFQANQYDELHRKMEQFPFVS